MFNTKTPDPTKPSNVFWGVGIFLAINFLVAAMYIKLINP